MIPIKVLNDLTNINDLLKNAQNTRDEEEKIDYLLEACSMLCDAIDIMFNPGRTEEN